MELAVPSTSAQALAEEIKHIKCDLCGKFDKNELFYGEFIQKLGFSVHYFCLLSATHCLQQGKSDSSGIFGFLKNDITAGIKKCKNNICTYCGEASAPIECAELGCTRTFHFICGFKNNCVTEFIGEFQSYCHEHVVVGNNDTHEPDYACWICFEKMGDYNKVQSIMPSCCNYGFFHRNCMIRFAMEAGYYTNCPFCADKNDEFNFLDEIQYRGVFIPKRDATWEQPKDAYADLVKDRCLQKGCLCPKKWAQKGDYRILTCVVCGCLPMHAKCTGSDSDEYHCVECKNKTFLNILKV